MLYPQAFDQKSWMLCYYKNESQTLQILTIDNVEDWYFERLVYPEERLAFEAPEMAQLQIHYQSVGEEQTIEIIPCYQIRVRYGLESEVTGKTNLKVVSINRSA
jgi:sucrose-6-phosphate hydrolase SacC (GH32 family)